MPTLRIDQPDFAALAAAILGTGNALRFRARGRSMQPAIQDGDAVEVAPVHPASLRIGDIILCRPPGQRLVAHRLIWIRRARDGFRFLPKGDAAAGADGWVDASDVLGRALRIERPDGHTVHLAAFPRRLAAFRIVVRTLARSAVRRARHRRA